MQNLRIKYILISAFVLFLLITICVSLIIVGYAFWLGFQAQEAPDSSAITAFATRYAPFITMASAVIFSFLTAWRTTHKVEDRITTHAVAIAFGGATLLILYGILFSEFSYYDFLTGLIMLTTSYIGAKISMKFTGDQPG